MSKQKNRQPEKPCKGTFNVRVAQRLHEKATIATADLGVKFNEFIKQALEHELISKDINISL
jgi:predicted HicB family RNase H-like nuclease